MNNVLFDLTTFCLTYTSPGSERLSANHKIKQVVEVTEDFEKFDKLKVLLQQIFSAGGNSKVGF